MSLFLSFCLVTVAVILVIIAVMERLRLERISRSLGGRWSWFVVLDRNRVPWVFIRLWPNLDDDHTAQAMNITTHFRVYAPKGLALTYGEEQIGVFRRPFYGLSFAGGPLLAARPVHNPGEGQRPGSHVRPAPGNERSVVIPASSQNSLKFATDVPEGAGTVLPDPPKRPSNQPHRA